MLLMFKKEKLLRWVLNIIYSRYKFQMFLTSFKDKLMLLTGCYSWPWSGVCCLPCCYSWDGGCTDLVNTLLCYDYMPWFGFSILHGWGCCYNFTGHGKCSKVGFTSIWNSSWISLSSLHTLSWPSTLNWKSWMLQLYWRAPQALCVCLWHYFKKFCGEVFEKTA